MSRVANARATSRRAPLPFAVRKVPAFAQGDGHRRARFFADHHQFDFFVGLIAADDRRQFFPAGDRLSVDGGDDVATEAELRTFDFGRRGRAADARFGGRAAFEDFLDPRSARRSRSPSALQTRVRTTLIFSL